MALFNINPAKLTHPGWHQIMSLPRCLTLTGKDELGMKPAGDITSLRGEHRQAAPTALPANQEIVLENIQGNVMEIVVHIDPREASPIEMNVLRAPGKEDTPAFCSSAGEDLGIGSGTRAGLAIVRDTSDSLISLDTSQLRSCPTGSHVPIYPAALPQAWRAVEPARVRRQRRD